MASAPAIETYLAEDTIDRDDLEALAAWLRGAPRLTKGPLTLAFEEAWAAWVGARRAVFVNSGSSADLLMYYALLAADRLKNKKVVVPACGWVTTIAPAIQFGLEPILCEADRETFGPDPGHLEDLVKRHDPAAVVVVHALGVPARLDEILALRERHGFVLLEDACAAVGSAFKGRKVGTFGAMGAYSSYFGHQISTIEGGLVATDDEDLYRTLVMLRSHGWSKDLDEESHRRLVERHGIDDFHRPFVFYHPGFNLRSTDLNAFLGLRQVKKMDWVVKRRSENHARYLERLGGALAVQRPLDGSRVASIHFAALAADGEARKRIVRALVASGIETRIYTAGNLGRHPFWYERYGRPNLPWADRIYATGFFLPNHPYMDAARVDRVCDVVLGAL